jgi:hypothetical protein
LFVAQGGDALEDGLVFGVQRRDETEFAVEHRHTPPDNRFGTIEERQLGSRIGGGGVLGFDDAPRVLDVHVREPGAPPPGGIVPFTLRCPITIRLTERSDVRTEPFRKKSSEATTTVRFPLGTLLLGLVLALSTTLVALAQADDDLGPTDDAVDTTMVAPAADQPPAAATLFLQLIEPAEQDVEVDSNTTELTVHGVTLAGAVVSIDGDLVDVDDEGGFVGVTPLDEGANEIEVVASDDQGNELSTTIVVVRGD